MHVHGTYIRAKLLGPMSYARTNTLAGLDDVRVRVQLEAKIELFSDVAQEAARIRFADATVRLGVAVLAPMRGEEGS